ncbi:hypothetical protein IJ101_00520 [Candidatus Saccharibacteria bacterium]|nr:hypothetical protein [Candidatus Saccharibacteria bacterium]
MLFRNKAKYIILISGIIAFGTIGSRAVHAESLDYNVSIQPSLAVTIPSNTVSLNLNPFTTPFNTASLPVTVSTNNPTGFSLTMSSTDTNLTLRSGSETIPTLATNTDGYSESDFTTNAWGYKLSTATNYSPFALSNQLLVTDAPTNAITSTVTFAAKADSTKPAGTYELAINFTAVANYVPPTSFSLYNAVASMSRGKNTAQDSPFSWTNITAPTSTNRTEDESTSGVFEWDGQDSNGGSNPIYFYRGILETNEDSGTYGSDGPANVYPNYVKLANNTCWRIVRTTSTGGVKIIYNGMWNSSTSTCANATTSAQLTTSPFNNTSATVSGTTYTGLQYKNIHTVGYTYSNLAAGTTAATPIFTIFGSTGNDTATNTKSSIIKQYLESWYGSNMTAYTSKLEGDAGYCNDRTLNTGESWTTPLADTDTIIPYGTTGMTEYNFGSRIRNVGASTFSPTLTCPRGKVDLYSYSGNSGNGNGQLAYPVALLTADEASLAGSGYSNSYNAYSANSYLRSGSHFWLLSPFYRRSNGDALGFFVYSSGPLGNFDVYFTYGVRPVISLSSGTRVLGSGTATDPWEVQ